MREATARDRATEIALGTFRAQQAATAAAALGAQLVRAADRAELAALQDVRATVAALAEASREARTAAARAEAAARAWLALGAP